MFCCKCGNEIASNAKFCGLCGTKTDSADNLETLADNTSINSQNVITDDNGWKPEMMVDPEPFMLPNPTGMSDVMGTETVVSMRPVRKKKALGIVISILSLIVIAVCVGGFLWYNKVYIPDQYEKQINLGEEYLSIGNYDKAISAYHDAIKVDSNREEAHIGLSDVYIILGEYDQARLTLEAGYEDTKGSRIQSKIEELEEEQIAENDDITTPITDDTTELDKPELIEESESANEAEEVVAEPVEQQVVNILVRQVDNKNFPNIKFYASIKDTYDESVKALNQKDFIVQEIDNQGNMVDVKLGDVERVLSSDQIFVNLVLDKSDSMNDDNKMSQAQTAASSFVKKVNLGNGDSVEIISFSDYVYLDQDFTSQETMLVSAINGIQASGSKALYDAIYASLSQSYLKDGSKCVIVFTDGRDNASSYTWEDVVYMAKNTGIPVFIIGIGAENDEEELSSLAQQCSGKYYSADTKELSKILEEIYVSIYQDTQEYYVFEYTSPNTADTNLFRSISIETSEDSLYNGTATKDYVPQADIAGDFSNLYASADFMIMDSDTRVITETDLSNMSLAQLRIARNEIFARHGRQFKDVALNKWFYSKTWYLNIGMKYSPSEFDAITRSPLSKLESDNVNLIKDYEKRLMENQDIFPYASVEILSDYDLALSKNVLKKALEQMKSYNNTAILIENTSRVESVIKQEEITY